MNSFASTALEERRVGKVYKGRLEAGLDLLFEWLTKSAPRVALSLPSGKIDFLILDQYVASFVNSCHEEKLSFHLVKHAILGLQTRYRYVRGHLPRSWDCLSAWEDSRPRGHRTPLTLELVRYLFTVAVSWSLEDRARAALLLPLAVLLLVGFEGLLRPGELVGLRRGDILLPRPHSLSKNVVIAIRSPKNRKYFGRQQFVTITDPMCIRWLSWLIELLPSPVKLWPSSPSVFRATFQTLVKRGGLTGHRFTPAGLRAGGATHLVAMGMDLSRVQFLGRWRAHQTMAIYVQEATAELVLMQISGPMSQCISAVLQEAADSLLQPPRLPWGAFFSRRRQWRTLQTWRRQ